MRTNGPFDFKTLAPGVLLLLFLLFVAWLFYALLFNTMTAVEKLRETDFELARSRALVAESGKLKPPMLVTAETAVYRQFQTGDSPSGATGTLQGNTSQMVRDSGLLLESMAAEPPAAMAKGGVSKLTISLRASGSEPALLRTLGAFERQDTAIVIDRLTVVAQETGPRANISSAPSLTIEMHIVGYWSIPRDRGRAKQ